MCKGIFFCGVSPLKTKHILIKLLNYQTNEKSTKATE